MIAAAAAGEKFDRRWARKRSAVQTQYVLAVPVVFLMLSNIIRWRLMGTDTAGRL